MDDGGVDRTVIDCRQNQLGWMAEFPPCLTFWLIKTLYHKLKSDLAARTDEFIYNNFIWIICGPIIKSQHLWVCTKFLHLHFPISLIFQHFYEKLWIKSLYRQTPSIPHFKSLAMRNLQYYIIFCQKIHDKVTMAMSIW